MYLSAKEKEERRKRELKVYRDSMKLKKQLYDLKQQEVNAVEIPNAFPDPNVKRIDYNQYLIDETSGMANLDVRLTKFLERYVAPKRIAEMMKKMKDEFATQDLDVLTKNNIKFDLSVKKTFQGTMTLNEFVEFVREFLFTVTRAAERSSLSFSNLVDELESVLKHSKAKNNAKIYARFDDIEVYSGKSRKKLSPHRMHELIKRIKEIDRGYDFRTLVDRLNGSAATSSGGREEEDANDEVDGSGFSIPGRKFKFTKSGIVVNGSGVSVHVPRYMRLNRYMVDIHDLMRGFLSVRYANPPIPKIVRGIPKLRLSPDLKYMLHKLLIHEDFDRNEFNELTEEDQRVFYNFTDKAHIYVGLQDIGLVKLIKNGEQAAGNQVYA